MPATTGHHRRGFTLAEVILALVILLVGALATLMILPATLKEQQLSRYKMYAALRAQDIIDNFAQHQVDFKERGDLYYNGGGRPNTNGWANPVRNIALMQVGGQFDLERIVTNHFAGNYPVPLDIARRLDSPGDAIGKIIDAGGYIYYSDPFSMGRFSEGLNTIGTERSTIPELQKLVWGVVGNAQNNALPVHPLAVPARELYPFPPRARSRPIPVDYAGTLEYRAVFERVENRGPGDWIQGVKLGAATQVAVFSYHLIDPIDMAYKNSNPESLPQLNNWEWFTYCDQYQGLNASNSQWIASIHDYRRLVYGHWLRIVHQLSTSGIVAKVIDESPANSWREGSTNVVDSNGKSISVAAAKINSDTLPLDPVEPKGTNLRGYPAPPTGIGRGRLRGTDVPYEDWETWVLDRDTQVRQGLPSLERRIMYRTAALALWAKVAPGGPYEIMAIPAADLDDPATLNSDVDPNIASNLAALPSHLNPLEQVLHPPNPADLHPTQVLALSHLAHACMLVTGYRPPFIDHQDTPEATDDIDLVEDESMPFKALAQLDDHFLYNPYHPDALTLNQLDGSSTDNRYQQRFDGSIIPYRRMVGEVLNPFPPPYADRGAFDMAGNRTYEVTITDTGGAMLTGLPANPMPATEPLPAGDLGSDILVRVTAYDTSLAGKDSEWAIRAHETALQWAMAYTSENPHDYIVPKPMNRQNMMDRALYQLAFFDQTGNAKRTPTNSDRYWISFASDRALFGAQYVYPDQGSSSGTSSVDPTSGYMDHNAVYRNLLGKYKLPLADTSAVTDAEYFPFGEMVPWQGGLGFPADTRDGAGFLQKTYGPQEAWQTHYLRNHGHIDGEPGQNGVVYKQGSQANLPNAAPWVENQFSLYRPFTPQERCRQLVFWVADWKQYDDAESAPSAPIDLSQLGKRTDGTDQSDARISSLFGNPELWFTWANPLRDGTLTRLPPEDVRKTEFILQDLRFRAISYQGHAWHTTHSNVDPWIQLGAYGADRNGNGVFDRGPVPRTTRMKATEVSRFNFYDPVVWTNVRR